MKISLRAARVNANLTQGDVAKHVRKTKQTIINWENGRTPIDAIYFEELCRLYKMPAEFISLPIPLGLN